jgi:hypothetical protein
MELVRRVHAVALAGAIAFVLGGALFAGLAHAEQRIALVVGNNAYANLDSDKQLINAISDARLMRSTLQSLGFEVLYGENLDRRQLVDKLFDFTAKLNQGDVALFFFAGHGVSFSGANYLLPTDVPAPRATGRAEEGRIAEQAIAETTIIERLTTAGAKVAIVVLDACRDNPLQGADRRSIGGTRGLGQSQPARGVFSIYSAGFGQAALDRLGPDDRNPNSVFTRVFAEKLRTPGLDLKKIATETRSTVFEMARKIGHDQVPAYYDQVIDGEVYLAGAPPDGGVRPAPPPAPPAIVRDPCAGALDHWRSAEAIASKAAYEDHLARFSSCPFAGLASARIAALSAPPPPPPPPAVPAVVYPSFSCSSARLPAELAICRSARLAALDVQMAGLYTALRGRLNTGDRSTLLGRQKSWLDLRNACQQDERCLEQRYLEQIRALGGGN